jgi:parallel beta-helix repeat protein
VETCQPSPLNNTITNNTCNENYRDGIHLDSSDNNTIRFNTITNNPGTDSGVHVASGCEGNLVNFNNIEGNTDMAFTTSPVIPSSMPLSTGGATSAVLPPPRAPATRLAAT